jgi:hypothetical protein
MNSHETLNNRLMLLVRNWKARNFSPARREHDRAMADRGIALEHQIQVGAAIERGDSDCTFCR